VRHLEVQAMTGKKPEKSSSSPPTAGTSRRRGAGVLHIPQETKQHLVAAAAYFRAARYRDIGADGCRKDDECDAAIEIEAVLARHHVQQ
jgi:hypothetical protein